MIWPFRKREPGAFVRFFAAWRDDIGGYEFTAEVSATTQQALEMTAVLASIVICNLPEHLHGHACRNFGHAVPEVIEQRKARAAQR